MPDDDRLVMAHGIVGLAEGTSRHWMQDATGLEADDVATLVADLAWRGLRGIRSESS